ALTRAEDRRVALVLGTGGGDRRHRAVLLRSSVGPSRFRGDVAQRRTARETKPNICSRSVLRVVLVRPTVAHRFDRTGVRTCLPIQPRFFPSGGIAPGPRRTMFVQVFDWSSPGAVGCSSHWLPSVWGCWSPSAPCWCSTFPRRWPEGRRVSRPPSRSSPVRRC